MKNYSHGILYAPDDGKGSGGTGGGADDSTDDDDPDDDDDDAMTPEEIADLKAENARLKAQAAKGKTEAARRVKAEKDAARRKAQEDGNQSELEKQLEEERKARESAEQKLQRSQAASIAKDLGAHNPEHIVRLLDWDTIVDPADKDEVKQAVRTLLKENSNLRKTTKDVDAGASGGGNDASSMNDHIRRAAGRPTT